MSVLRPTFEIRKAITPLDFCFLSFIRKKGGKTTTFALEASGKEGGRPMCGG
jgi:hypothetical protein